MPTGFSGRQPRTTTSQHMVIVPPVPSNVPPMAPPTPTGVPVPFPHMGRMSSADSPSTKLKVAKGKTVVIGNKVDCLPPANNPSQPAPLHDLTTMKVNRKIAIKS